MAKRDKQDALPGMKQATHADIERAASSYSQARDERMELTEAEVKRQQALLVAMKKHGLEKYKLEDGRVVEIVAGDEKVKVRAARDEATLGA
jgi:hypothetical protein